MSAINPATFYVTALFAALIALLKWTYRRDTANRRLAKGLRSYTASAQVLS